MILATTAAGAERLRAADPPPNVRIEVVGTGRQLSAASLLDVAAPTGARLVVCEGGPHLIGDLVTAERLDELFLTVAPRLAGRDEANRRLGLVAGAAFVVSDAP